MKSLIVIGAVVALAHPVSAQTLAQRWEVRYDAAPRDILAGDTVPVADGARHGVLELEVRGDSVVAQWHPDGSGAAEASELRGTWENGALRLVGTDARTVHPTVNGQEMSVDLYATWDGRLVGTELRGTISYSSRSGMVNGGTRAFQATAAGDGGASW